MGAPIILDATPLGGGHGVRGIGTAVRGLVGGMASALPAEERPALLVRAGTRPPAGFATRTVALPRWPGARLGLPDPWPALIGGRALRAARPRLVHTTTPDLVPGGLDLVATCFDLIPLRFGSLYLRGGPARVAYRRYLAALRRARAVIATSRATADDLVTLAAVPGRRIHVVPLGPSPHARPGGGPPGAARGPAPGSRAGTGTEAGTAEAAAGGAPYLLYAGGLEPHKNAHVAVDLLRHAPEDVRLVMVGPWSRRRSERLMRHAAASGVAGRVDAAGYVDAGRLSRLTAGAAAVVVPSLVEGFGLPALDAMAAGTPVLVSTAGALVEVVGDAAPALAPDRPDLWGAEVTRLLRDPGAREAAVARGRERAASFTWEDAARRTAAVYREVLDA